MITQYTTPPISVKVKDIDITDASYIYVTIKQGTTEVTKETTDIIATVSTTDTVLTFALTQEESGSFDPMAYANIQANWIKGGIRYATEIKQITVNGNLLDEVLE